jgi:hypothetical protein
MKRSLQEVVELVVFGLIALLVGTGLVWLVGWLLGIVSVVFLAIAGWVWQLLRFIIPVALVAGVIFFIVRLVTNRDKKVVPVASVQPVTTPTPPKAEPVTKVTEPSDETMPPANDETLSPSDAKDIN